MFKYFLIWRDFSRIVRLTYKTPFQSEAGITPQDVTTSIAAFAVILILKMFNLHSVICHVEAPIYEQTHSNLDQFSLGANCSRVQLHQSISGNFADWF